MSPVQSVSHLPGPYPPTPPGGGPASHSFARAIWYRKSGITLRCRLQVTGCGQFVADRGSSDGAFSFESLLLLALLSAQRPAFGTRAAIKKPRAGGALRVSI